MKWLSSLLLVLCLAFAPMPLAAQSTPGPMGDGLRGDYYEGHNFERFLLRRVDRTIYFSPTQEPPVPGVPAEDFSVRWTGWLRPPATGRYLLYITVDDGARLWLDGRQLLDEWRGQPSTSYKVELNLQAGRAYSLRLDYCQYGALYNLWLGWVQPAQFARADSASSWRNLWGLAASEPPPSAIATRYLFSSNPNVTPAPARPQTASLATRPPAAPPRPPAAIVGQRPAVQAVARVHKPLPAAQASQPPAPLPATQPAPVAAPAPVVVQPTSVLSKLTSGQTVTLPALYFAQGKADLLPPVKASLDTLAATLAQSPQLRLQVQGHTDNQGDSTLNRLLSQQRAEAVCRYLAEHGIAPARLQAVGYGGRHPIASNESPGLRARNRRVVLQPLP